MRAAFRTTVILGLALALSGCGAWHYVKSAFVDIPAPNTAPQALASVRVSWASIQDNILLYTSQPICVKRYQTQCADRGVVIELAAADAEARRAIEDAEALVTASADKSLTSAGASAAREALARLYQALARNGISTQ